MKPKQLHEKAAEAVKHFWQVRQRQGAKQSQATSQRDAGYRTAVTGGKQLDGFAELVSEILVDAGLPEHNIYRKRGSVAVPGYIPADERVGPAGGG